MLFLISSIYIVLSVMWSAYWILTAISKRGNEIGRTLMIAMFPWIWPILILWYFIKKYLNGRP